MKKIYIEGVPHLCIFTLNGINENDEIQYWYGVNDLDWHAEVKENENRIATYFCRDLRSDEVIINNLFLIIGIKTEEIA